MTNIIATEPKKPNEQDENLEEFFDGLIRRSRESDNIQEDSLIGLNPRVAARRRAAENKFRGPDLIGRPEGIGDSANIFGGKDERGVDKFGFGGQKDGFAGNQRKENPILNRPVTTDLDLNREKDEKVTLVDEEIFGPDGKPVGNVDKENIEGTDVGMFDHSARSANRIKVPDEDSIKSDARMGGESEAVNYIGNKGGFRPDIEHNNEGSGEIEVTSVVSPDKKVDEIRSRTLEQPKPLVPEGNGEGTVLEKPGAGNEEEARILTKHVGNGENKKGFWARLFGVGENSEENSDEVNDKASMNRGNGINHREASYAGSNRSPDTSDIFAQIEAKRIKE